MPIILVVALLIFTLISVSLAGARAPAAQIVLTMIFALFLMKGMPVKPIYIVSALMVVLAFPVLFSIVREGRDFSIALFFQYMSGGIFQRVFITPMETGLWHAHYAQTVGYIGVAGIPRLATLFGVESINLANIIFII